MFKWLNPFYSAMVLKIDTGFISAKLLASLPRSHLNLVWWESEMNSIPPAPLMFRPEGLRGCSIKKPIWFYSDYLRILNLPLFLLLRFFMVCICSFNLAECLLIKRNKGLNDVPSLPPGLLQGLECPFNWISFPSLFPACQSLNSTPNFFGKMTVHKDGRYGFRVFFA